MGNEGVSWHSLTASAGEWGWRGSVGQTNISLDHSCMEQGVNNACHWIPNTGRMCDGKCCVYICIYIYWYICHVMLNRYLIMSFPKLGMRRDFSAALLYSAYKKCLSFQKNCSYCGIHAAAAIVYKLAVASSSVTTQPLPRYCLFTLRLELFQMDL